MYDRKDLSAMSEKNIQQSPHMPTSSTPTMESYSPSTTTILPTKAQDIKARATPKSSKPTAAAATAMRTSKRQPSKLNSGINGGRWTQKEHEDFLVGLELYGREWKKVASHISTRTSAQIRSHAQKYFAKINKDLGSNRKGSEAYGFSDGDEPLSSSRERKSGIPLYSRGAGGHDEKSRAEIRHVEPLPSADAMIASLSPKTRKKVSKLGADEVCAVHVLASYAAREVKRIKYSDHE